MENRCQLDNHTCEGGWCINIIEIDDDGEQRAKAKCACDRKYMGPKCKTEVTLQLVMVEIYSTYTLYIVHENQLKN